MPPKTSNGYLSIATLTTVEQIRLQLSEKPSLLNECNTDGETPLLMACQTNNLDAVEYLLSRGANVGYVSKEGRNALHSAIHSRNYRILDAVLAHPNKVATHSVAPSSSSAVLPNASDVKQHQPQQWTTKRLIVENVLDLDHVDHSCGHNALRVAAEMFWWYPFTRLLDLGATPSVGVNSIETIFPLLFSRYCGSFTPKNQRLFMEKWLVSEISKVRHKRKKEGLQEAARLRQEANLKKAAERVANKATIRSRPVPTTAAETSTIGSSISSTTAAPAEGIDDEDAIPLFGLFGMIENDNNDNNDSKDGHVAAAAPVVVVISTIEVDTNNNDNNNNDNKDTSPVSAASTTINVSRPDQTEVKNEEKKRPVIGDDDWCPVLEDLTSFHPRYNTEYLFNLMRRIVSLSSDPYVFLVHTRRLRVMEMVVSRFGIEGCIERYHHSHDDERDTRLGKICRCIRSHHM